jgi:hypothetical protein
MEILRASSTSGFSHSLGQRQKSARSAVRSVYPQDQTSLVQPGMSEKCNQFRTLDALLNHLVSKRDEIVGDFQAKGIGGF